MSQHRRTQLLDRLTTHIAPLPPRFTTFDAFRDAEARGAFAQPTTLTNPFFANPLPIASASTAASAPDDQIIHAAHHVANNTPAYRNRLREQQRLDTQRIDALRASLKRTAADLRLLDRAAEERARALQHTLLDSISAAAPASASAAPPPATKKKHKPAAAPPSSSSSSSSSDDSSDSSNNKPQPRPR